MPTTHHPHGITNVTAASTMGEMTCLDPTRTIVFHEDFINPTDITASSPSSYTATVIGTGTRTFGNGSGGLLVLTNSAADDDQISIQRQGDFFLHSASKSFAMKTRFKLSEVIQSDALVGLALTDTTPLDASTMVGFLKVDGSAVLSAVLTTAGATTTVGSTTLVADTFVTLGLRYSASSSKVEFLVNEVVVGSTSVLTNVSTSVGMTPTMSVKNGEAVAKIMTIDYLTVVQDSSGVR